MDDIKIIEAVERYITGQMSPDERVYFEQLRKSSPEVDQMVVEHTYFLHQLNRFDETKKIKNKLNDVHIELAEKGMINSPKLSGKARVFYLLNRYKKTAAIAASIAGITVLSIAALVWIASPVKPATKSELQLLNKKIEEQNYRQNKEIKNIKEAINSTTTTTDINPQIPYTSGGTGFLIDPKGYLVTNAHVIQNANNIAVQNAEGKHFKVKLVHLDEVRDIAILKIDDSRFKSPSSLPYSIKKSSANIAESVFTLGYPRNDIVYGEGYLAAKTGYNGDTLSCQIAIAANPGNSGAPIINRNGEVIGVISTKQASADGAVFAVQSKYIYQTINELLKNPVKQKDSSYKKIKLPTSSSLKGMDRTKQAEKISDFVYMVKVS